MDTKKFWETWQIPPAKLSPIERQRRRMAWRNERHLHKRFCDLCAKSLISVYPEECDFPIYCSSCFWSDKWDPREYGRDFDFNKPFFEQFDELLRVVPHLALTQSNCVNSEYALNCVENKNCYLTSGADYNEDCMYGVNSQRSKFCIDFAYLFDCELCYGCLDSQKLYNCVGCQDSENCSDSWFLFDCKGCQNCAFSTNLRNKSYVFAGEQLSKGEYEKRLEEAKASLFERSDWVDEERRGVRGRALQRHALLVNCENVSGDYLRNCKDCSDTYDSEELRDCEYCYYALGSRDLRDVCCIGWGELQYETISTANCYSSAFSHGVLTGNNVWYSAYTFSSNNLFGCVSVRNHAENLILNKQYSPKEFEEMRARVIEHMRGTGEFGEYFPGALSPFEYNRSMLIDHMPLEKAEALRLGYHWHDGEDRPGRRATSEVPAVDEILGCLECEKNYRILEQEADIHKKIGVPLSRICWGCRLKKLINSRRREQLFERECSGCDLPLKTSLEKGEVYCEKCYVKRIY